LKPSPCGAGVGPGVGMPSASSLGISLECIGFFLFAMRARDWVQSLTIGFLPWRMKQNSTFDLLHPIELSYAGSKHDSIALGAAKGLTPASRQSWRIDVGTRVRTEWSVFCHLEV